MQDTQSRRPAAKWMILLALAPASAQ